MGCTEAPTRAVLQRRTAPLISPWTMYPTRRGRRAEVPTDQNLSARQGILSRYPWAPRYQVGGRPTVPGGGGEGSDPARLRGPPARSALTPLLRLFGRRRLKTETFSRFSRAACPAADVPAQTLSQSLSSLRSAKFTPQRFREERKPLSSWGGQGAVVWGCLNIRQDRSVRTSLSLCRSLSSPFKGRDPNFFL